ncbi:hypothetical protein RND81_13G039600 [Saponaria officinalis]|uniref:Neprosin PEP catalytic domain-containing protein n=1 Tax=Saponaria officinalis TaxID=3572 RepID=A0AAW1GWV7_SAPOF
MLFKTIGVCLVVSIFTIAAVRLSCADVSEHAIKTIKTEYGVIYDCVDFYKQPAFDHPLLKNHSFHPQMRPSFQPKTMTNNVLRTINATEINITPLNDGGCPRGTVPIRRINKNKVHPNTPNGYTSGAVFAISQTKSSLSNIYNGVGAIVTVFKPRVMISQYSSAEIIIKGGTDSIVVGWTVNPNKYSDSETRFFIYSVAGDMHCFNSECGFVIVRSDIPLDFLLKPVSVRGHQIYVYKFFIFRDPKLGTWWLQVGGIEKEPITLGYWPQNIFTGLQTSGTYVACGGEVYTPATLPPPDMGTGLHPNGYLADDAFCTELVVVDNNNTVVYVTDTELYMNDDTYVAMDFRTKHPFHRFPFGGPNPN